MKNLKIKIGVISVNGIDRSTIDDIAVSNGSTYANLPKIIRDSMCSYSLSEFIEVANDSDSDKDYLKLDNQWLFTYYE